MRSNAAEDDPTREAMCDAPAAGTCEFGAVCAKVERARGRARRKAKEKKTPTMVLVTARNGQRPGHECQRPGGEWEGEAHPLVTRTLSIPGRETTIAS